MSTRSFQHELGEQLVVAHGRLARRRRRRSVIAAVALVAVAALSVSVLTSSTSAPPAAAGLVEIVDQPDGTRLIRLPLLGASPDGLEADFAAAGISNEIVPAKTGPSRVGTVISMAITGGNSRAIDKTTIEVASNFQGKIFVNVGVPAKPRARYDQPSKAFDAGEPLEGFEPRTDARAVAARAKELGLKVQLVGPSGKFEKSIPPGATAELVSMFASDLVQINFK